MRTTDEFVQGKVGEGSPTNIPKHLLENYVDIRPTKSHSIDNTSAHNAHETTQVKYVFDRIVSHRRTENFRDYRVIPYGYK